MSWAKFGTKFQAYSIGDEKLIMSKTLSLEINDVVEIEKCIKNGKAQSINDFVQKAVRMYLKNLEGDSVGGIQKN